MLKKVLVTALCVLIASILAVFGYWSYITGMWGIFASSETDTQTLYFLDNTKTKLVEESRMTKPSSLYVSSERELSNLVEQLIIGPKNTMDLKRAIPQDTKVLWLKKEGRIATVNFSKEYHGASAADDILSAFTVVNTLCATGKVDKVVILVEGNELIGTDKKPLGALGKDDIVYEGAKNQTETVTLSLYFPNADATYLSLESRTVALNDKEPLAKLALSELLKGPEDKTKLKIIPAEAKILSVEIKDFVCFVNFSKEFVDKHTQGSTSEIMTIYSIVNTLTSLPDVSKVQFLIEGQKVDTFGQMIFNEPFERNTDYIEKFN